MKTINKIMLFVITCLALSNVTTNCFYYGDDPGANVIGNAGTATFLAGAATGNRRATYAGLGLMGAGAIAGASRNSRRRRYDDDYYRDRSYQRSSRYRNLEDENADLRARLRQYENGY